MTGVKVFVSVNTGCEVWVAVFTRVKDFVGVNTGVGVLVLDIVGTEVFDGVGEGMMAVGKSGLEVMVGTGCERATSRVAIRSRGSPVADISRMI